jgi:undecaprenyl phosphate-alpha-L-ara4FN deformylase
MKIGLRIDVDTFRGTRLGVPNLCRLLESRSMNASFFFSVGPDNMGRHLWRCFKPVFLWKMLRTKAASLYGWDILLRGTFWPGPIIGEKLGSVIRSAFDAGHEVGLHAYDHHAWQAHIDAMDEVAIYREIKKGYDLLEKILGKPPTCSAVPGWKCNEAVLLAKNRFAFDYNSDCRGKSIFRPIAGGCELLQPQVPVTLPTYDEVVGRNGVTDGNYNDYMLSLLDPAKLNVLTIHAEVEGIACLEMFGQFMKRACSKGYSFVPLRVLLQEYSQIDPAAIVSKEIPGRQGWVCCQSDLSNLAVLSQT